MNRIVTTAEFDRESQAVFSRCLPRPTRPEIKVLRLQTKLRNLDRLLGACGTGAADYQQRAWRKERKRVVAELAEALKS